MNPIITPATRQQLVAATSSAHAQLASDEIAFQGVVGTSIAQTAGRNQIQQRVAEDALRVGVLARNLHAIAPEHPAVQRLGESAVHFERLAGDLLAPEYRPVSERFTSELPRLAHDTLADAATAAQLLESIPVRG